MLMRSQRVRPSAQGNDVMTAYVRNRLAIALAAALLTASAGLNAWSQATGPIKIVVPYTPGSGPDILSRLMAEQIGRAQGPTVVVENRPGGGTVIGTEAVERAEPDGRTVLLVANSFVINPPLQRASYNPSTSFEPVCYLAATPMVLVVLGSSPYRTLNDLIAAARAKPGELAFASGGPGSSLHIAIEVLKRAANLNITYVPYGGTAPATSHARIETLPDVPTLGETGVSNYEAEIFYGIVAPAKTPSDVLNRLSGWFSSALKAPDMKPKLAQQGLFPVGMCGAEFGAYLRRQVEEYSRVIREADITVK
jgi:tripartite-type tricarboxylate transporter receptor subunit TctC